VCTNPTRGLLTASCQERSFEGQGSYQRNRRDRDRTGDWNTALELAGTLRTAVANQRATGAGYLANDTALSFVSYRLELIEKYLKHQASVEAVRSALNDLAQVRRSDYKPAATAKPGAICDEGSFCEPAYLVCRANRCVNACPPGQVLYGGTNCVRYCERDSDCPHGKGPCVVDESTHQGQKTCPPEDPQ
jgi:hypothetical protein